MSSDAGFAGHWHYRRQLWRAARSVDALGEHTLVGCLLSFGTVGADPGLAVSFTSFVVAPCTLAPCGTASGLLWVSFYQVFHFMYAFFDPTSVPQSSR